MGDIAWIIAVVGGPILLALIIAYGMLRNRRMTPRERQKSESATRRLYDEEAEREAR